MEEVQEEGANAAVHVEHQVGGLGERVALHRERVVQVARAGEKLARVLLQQLHALVAVVLQFTGHVREGGLPEQYVSNVGPQNRKSTYC